MLIRRAGTPPLQEPSPKNVLFTHPQSLNGCWVQLGLLEDGGHALPDRVDSLRYAPGPGSANRVVHTVLLGESPFGACRASDLAALTASGAVAEDELVVVAAGRFAGERIEVPAVPRATQASVFNGAFAQRSALVRTGIIQRSVLPLVMGHADLLHRIAEVN